MTLSSELAIGNTEDANMSIEDFNNAFASVKVNVTGDFTEKEMGTPVRCFEYAEIEGGVEITGYDDSCGTEVVVPEEINGLKVLSIDGECHDIEGMLILSSAFQGTNITSIEIPNTVTTIGSCAFYGTKLTSLEIPNSVTSIGRFLFSSGYDSKSPLSSVTFEEASKITEIPINSFLNCSLKNVTIPGSVTSIGDSAFSRNQIETLEIPDSVTAIENGAFSNNQIETLEIPDSVTTIGNDAFRYNQLKTVTIGSGIQYMGGSEVFCKTSSSNPDLESITFTSKTCEEIKNIQASNSSTTKYFPWLQDWSPYYHEDYKASIIGTDGECSY